MKTHVSGRIEIEGRKYPLLCVYIYINFRCTVTKLHCDFVRFLDRIEDLQADFLFEWILNSSGFFILKESNVNLVNKFGMECNEILMLFYLYEHFCNMKYESNSQLPFEKLFPINEKDSITISNNNYVRYDLEINLET